MLIKANHAPLFLVNSYYPCFTLALTNGSARHCESLGVMGMQSGRAAFRSPHWHVHLEIGCFTPAQVLVENVKMWDVLLTHKNTSLLDSFFFFPPPSWLGQNETPAVEQRLLKVLKSWGCFEFALQRTLWSAEREGRVVSLLLFHIGTTRTERSVVWPGHCVPQPWSSRRNSEVPLMKYGWSKMLLKTDCPTSQTRKDGVNY